MKEQIQLPHDIVELPLFPFIPAPVVWQIVFAVSLILVLLYFVFFRGLRPAKTNFLASLLLQLETFLNQAALSKFDLDQIALILRRLMSSVTGVNCMGATLREFQPGETFHQRIRNAILELDQQRYRLNKPDIEKIRKELLEIVRQLREDRNV